MATLYSLIKGVLFVIHPKREVSWLSAFGRGNRSMRRRYGYHIGGIFPCRGASRNPRKITALIHLHPIALPLPDCKSRYGPLIAIHHLNGEGSLGFIDEPTTILPAGHSLRPLSIARR